MEINFQDYIVKLPVGFQTIVCAGVATAVKVSMRELIEGPPLEKDKLDVLGLRQCVMAGEGESDLRKRIDYIQRIVVELEDMVGELEDKAKGAI